MLLLLNRLTAVQLSSTHQKWDGKREEKRGWRIEGKGTNSLPLLPVILQALGTGTHSNGTSTVHSQYHK